MAARHMPRVIATVMMPSILVATVVYWSLPVQRAHSQKTGGIEANSPPRSADQVDLTAEKVASAGIKSERIGMRLLQPMRMVPGRLRYDERRHVEVKTAAAGIVRQIQVKPGDHVKMGDLLSVVSSAEVGGKRADLLNLTAARDLSVKRLEHSRAIKEGLNQLAHQIEQEVDPRDLPRQFEGIALGEYRSTVISAYAAWRSAEAMHRSGEAGGGSAVLSGRQIEQRRGEYVAARAALQSAIEQSVFEAEMACIELENRVADAERRVTIGAQSVAALQGTVGEGAADPSSPELLDLRLLAPIDGTLESQVFAVGERIAAGDGLFIVADTSQLWVEADIREQEWEALRLEPGQTVTVTGSTISNKPLVATVLYVGREVSSATNAASIIATIANPRGSLRPGQFVQIRVPVDRVREALAVPQSAIVEHDGQKFVFVQESPTGFRRVDIHSGVAADGMVEVIEGPRDGAVIVTEGAFALKSELLLDRSEE